MLYRTTVADSWRWMRLDLIIRLIPLTLAPLAFAWLTGTPLSRFGFWADWTVEPRWNLCDAPGGDNGGKVDAVRPSCPPGRAWKSSPGYAAAATRFPTLRARLDTRRRAGAT